MRIKTMLAVLTAGCALTISAAYAGDNYSVEPAVKNLKSVPQRILLVGNSFMYYNCGVNGYISGFAKAQKQKLATSMVTIGGAGLDWHDVKSYLRRTPLQATRL